MDSAGGQGNAASFNSAISADGRFVAFDSEASNLVAGDTNGVRDVFVHDHQTGATTRVSVDSAGGQANGFSGTPPAISADGRFVAFASSASNLVAGDTNGTSDIFVHDRQTGVTTRVSVDSAGGQANGDSGSPAISADGRFVVFDSAASNLVAGDTNGVVDVFVHDRQTGATTRVSVDSAGGQANNGHSPTLLKLSADGRFVAFPSIATNLVAGDTNNALDVFVHDRQTGATTRVSVDSAGGQANSNSQIPAISADGRFIAFRSVATNLVAGDTNNREDIFVHDRQTGVTTRVSVDSAGGQGNSLSLFPTISADGRFVAFDSEASNLVAGDTNGTFDIFVHDRQTGATTRVSVDSAGGQGNSFSFLPTISADGRFVAFTSSASNLVAGDTNLRDDIFVHDRGPTEVAVDIDIKPGSFPNSINLGSGGTVPVAIFSSASFDATTINPTTVTLASAPVNLKGKGTPMASFQDVNGDGLLDLVVHVTTEALQLSETDTEAVLEGQTFDGTPITGTDSVRIVP